jgi:glutaminase
VIRQYFGVEFRESVDRFTSAGRLPAADEVQAAVDEAWRRFHGVTDGSPSTVYPALAGVDPALFGIAVSGTSGRTFTAGDATTEFTIMSVAKPFVLALVVDDIGLDPVRQMVGANATGFPFNAIEAVERSPQGRTNPMVNPGAIATTSLVTGSSPEHRWATILDGLGRFAGRRLHLDDSILESALTTNHRNRALANLLTSVGALSGDPADAVELYTRQSCLAVTAVDLAVMGATLADGGVNPVTHEAVVRAETAQAVLAMMTVAGMYETSGDWLLDVGVPAKSGIGGGIISVAAGKGCLATFSPPLDAAGNSVRGQLAAAYLARALGLDMLASAPDPTHTGSSS